MAAMKLEIVVLSVFVALAAISAVPLVFPPRSHFEMRPAPVMLPDNSTALFSKCVNVPVLGNTCATFYDIEDTLVLLSTFSCF
jgi:hypothetical protein